MYKLKAFLAPIWNCSSCSLGHFVNCLQTSGPRGLRAVSNLKDYRRLTNTLGWLHLPNAPCQKEMTRQSLDKTLFQFTAVPAGRLPTRQGLTWLGGESSLSKAVLCGTNLSPQKEALLFHSRSQNVRVPAALCSRLWRAEGNDLRDGTEATGLHTGHSGRTKEVEAFQWNESTTDRLITASASLSLSLCKSQGPTRLPVLVPWTCPSAPAALGPRGSQEVPKISASKCQSSGQRTCLCSSEPGLKQGWNDHMNSPP